MVEHTEEEIQEIKDILRPMLATGKFYKEQADWLWNNYKAITGSRESQPCTCPRAGHLWIKAMNEIQNYINKNV